MIWTRLKSPFVALEVWGMRLPSGTTLVVSFDSEFPEMKWRASYKHPNDPTEHYLDAFSTKEIAMKRILEASGG